MTGARQNYVRQQNQKTNTERSSSRKKPDKIILSGRLQVSHLCGKDLGIRQLVGQELVTGGCKDKLRCSLKGLVATELHQVTGMHTEKCNKSYTDYTVLQHLCCKPARNCLPLDPEYDFTLRHTTHMPVFLNSPLKPLQISRPLSIILSAACPSSLTRRLAYSEPSLGFASRH